MTYVSISLGDDTLRHPTHLDRRGDGRIQFTLVEAMHALFLTAEQARQWAGVLLEGAAWQEAGDE